jgi:nitrous oxide reductase accessory protein NosL
MKRRDMLKLPLAAAAMSAVSAQAAVACEGDGTPNQFIPKAPKDASPLDNELMKYPKCPYCGMDRTQYHHARHLVQYADDLVDGTCSIHCLSISLAINLDREPKAIYAPDNGSVEAIKPLINVDQAIYLIGGSTPGVMTKRSKVPFGSQASAQAEQAKTGGELGDFSAALTASYADLAQDTLMIRKRRNERRQQMMKKAG